jgi:hypothetical protein
MERESWLRVAGKRREGWGGSSSSREGQRRVRAWRVHADPDFDACCSVLKET